VCSPQASNLIVATPATGELGGGDFARAKTLQEVLRKTRRGELHFETKELSALVEQQRSHAAPAVATLGWIDEFIERDVAVIEIGEVESKRVRLAVERYSHATILGGRGAAEV
jgi:hypothetical protein